MSNNIAVIISKDGKQRTLDDPKIKVLFDGEGNYFSIKEPYSIANNLTVKMGNNSCVVIESGLKVYNRLNITLKNFNRCIIGKEFHMHFVDIFNWTEPFIDVKIGKNCLFSSEISIRTSDGHTIFEIDSKKVVNQPDFGISIGDHVWIGSKVDILKDSKIGNNCVIGTRALLCGGEFPDNCVIAGNPAKIIKKEINWDTDNTYDFNLKHF